ncbi:putative glycoside hydrolase family 18 protein [Diaporthe ampelina]|uniref:chitinase n=1 Tax=Diaporthe ampelina TaxID=1214573 RepID=A0A0G2HZ51_9PEZI|nr:putative glycoside hydrolase family 18 protein [Diaporthe ampelina]
MYPRESLVVAALAAVPVLATSSSVNVYWGQQGNGDLATACQDPSVDYITLGFINISPENGGPAEYPGTNFGAHCWAEKYSVDGHTSELLSTCPSLTPGIAVCQELGKKVLLSIGGVYTAYSNYTVSSPENGVAFAEFVWGAFGPYSEAWAGKPRPFDNGDKHNAVDGFDFDLESSSAGDEGYAAMITTLRALIAVSGRNDIITAAPQCPLEDEWQTMAYLLQNVQFDRLWIQFYNNEQCSLLNADGTPNPGFNYAAWEEYLAHTPSKNAKLHIGLPGSADAAGSGYVDASVASSYLCKYSDYSMFGGVMVWDQWFAAQNTIDGASYNQVLYESMKCGCKACPVPTSTISTVASSTAASTSLSTVPPVTITSSTTTAPASTPTCTGLSGWDKDGKNIGFYADAASATYSGCLALCDANEACLSFGVLSTPACALYDYTVEGNVVADSSSGNTFYDKGGRLDLGSFNHRGTPHVTTSVIPVSSTVVPVPTPGGDGDETVTATVVPITSTSAGPVPGGEHLTTSTIYSTTVYTVTSCAATVTDCPGKLGSVTTQIIAISTTVCPVTEGGHTAPTPPAENGGSGSTPSETKPVGSGPSPTSPGEGEGGSPKPNPSTPAGGEGSNASSSSPAGGEGSHSSPPEETEETEEAATTTSTVTTKLHSTITLPVVSVPTAGNEGSAPAPVNNAGTEPSHGFGNSTATKTFSLATVKPTGAGVPVPQSTETPVVTAGAARGVVGAGMTMVVGVMIFML